VSSVIANLRDILLDDRVLRPISYKPFAIIYVAWIIIMQAMFWKSKSLERSFIIFGAVWIGVFFALMGMGYFLNFWKGGAGLGSVVVRYAESKGEAVAKGHG
jgi:hypothetical protein